AATGRVERLAGLRGAGLVSWREYLECLPSAYHGIGQRRIGATSYHQLGPAATDLPKRLPNGGGSRGAGHTVSERAVAQAQLDRHVRGGGVVHTQHHGHGGHAFAAMLPEIPVAALK